MSATGKIRMVSKSDIKLDNSKFDYSDIFSDFLMLRCIHNNKFKINKSCL